METDENKIIRNKIDSLNSLPHGYAPNLESKWELIDASLRPRKKSRTLFYMIRAGIAAALLLTGGTIWLMFDSRGSHHVEQVTSASGKTESIQLQKTHPLASTPSAVKTRRKQRNNPAIKIAPAPEQQSIAIASKLDTSVIIDAENPVMLITKNKPKRYTEIDFNDAVISDQTPSETVINAQEFRFRIGFGSKSNASNKSDHSSPVSFRHKLN